MNNTKRIPKNFTRTAHALGRLLDIQRAQNRIVTEEEIEKIGKLSGANMTRLRASAKFINVNFTGR